MTNIISLAPWILFAVVVAVSAIIGLVRGLNKSVIRLMLLAVAAILTFFVAGPIAKAIVQSIKIDGLTLGQLLLESLQDAEGLVSTLLAVPAVQEMVLALPLLAVAIIVFPAVFLLLNLISWIAYLCAQKPLRKLIFKDSGSEEEAAAKSKCVRIGKRFAGMGVGIVCGVLVFGMLLAPFYGVFSALPASATMEKMLLAMADDDDMTAQDAELLGAICGITDNGLAKFYRYIGIAPAGKAYLNGAAAVQNGDQTIRLLDELETLMTSVETLSDSGLLDALTAAADPGDLYKLLADRTFTDSLMKNMFQSDLLRASVPDLLAAAMEGVASGMGIPADKDAVYDDLMAGISLAVRDAEIDYAAIDAYEKENSIVYTFARSAISARSGSEAAVMTEAEYEAEIQKLVDLTMAISKMLNNALSGSNTTFADSVAAWIVSDVKTQAAENGQSAAGYDAAAVQSAIGSIDAGSVEAGEGDAGALLEQLTDKEKFETDVATVDTIVDSIRGTVKSALEDDAAAQEAAGTLASVVADFAEAVSSAVDEDGNLDIQKLDFEKVANAVTTLQNSSLKAVGSSLLDIMAASDLGGNAMVGDLLGAVKEGYESGEDISGAIGSTGALIGMGSAMNGETGENKEAMVNSLTDLINNLDEFTIGLLPSILTSDTIASMGVPAEQTEATYNMIETLLKELMKLKGAADYDTEVDSILALYNLASSGVDTFTEEDIPKLAGYAMKSDAIYNTLISTSSSNPFGIEIPDGAVRAMLVDAIEDCYAQSGRTQKEKDIYFAIARLLGIDDNISLS